MAWAINNCCFCIKLEIGSLIIGYLNLIWDLIVTPLFVHNLVIAINLDRKFDLVIASLMIIFFIIHLIFSIVLLVGLHKRKRGLLNTYLIYTLVANLVVISIVILIIIICIMIVFSSAPIPLLAPSAGKIIGILIYTVLTVYSLVVIRSYSLKMDDTSRKSAIYNPV